MVKKNAKLVVGQAYFVRTVTYHYVGQLVSADDSWLVLSDASWVADSGVRFGEALSTGALSETERYPGAVWLNRDAIVDLTVWNHPLPKVSQ